MHIFRILLCVLILPLVVGCSNLAASLTGGTRTETFTPEYEYRGQTHSMTITFTIEKDSVSELSITPGAIATSEQAHQLALAANVREFVLQKKVNEIEIPVAAGDEERLRKVFRGVLEELKEK